MNTPIGVCRRCYPKHKSNTRTQSGQEYPNDIHVEDQQWYIDEWELRQPREECTLCGKIDIVVDTNNYNISLPPDIYAAPILHGVVTIGSKNRRLNTQRRDLLSDDEFSDFCIHTTHRTFRYVHTSDHNISNQTFADAIV